MLRIAPVVMVVSCMLAGCEATVELPPPPGAGTLAGRVVWETPGVGRTVPAGAARLELVGSGLRETADATTGRFRFDRLPPPPRRLLVQWSSTGGAIDRQLEVSGGAIDRGGAVELGDLVVGANAEVIGRVVLEGASRDGAEQIGTVVFVPGHPWSTLTGPGGAFWLPSLPPGRLSLGFTRAGHVVGAIDRIELSAGASLTLAEATLARLPPGAPVAGSISGSVEDESGAKAAGVAVRIAPLGGGAAAHATTDAEGRFSQAIAIGAYEVTAGEAPGPTATAGGVLVAGDVELGALTLSTEPPLVTTPQASPSQPIARPGPDRAVLAGQPVALDGSASSGARLSYRWSIAGAPVAPSINDSTLAMRTSFVAPDARATLTVGLVVTDAFGRSSERATATVFVDRAPTASLAPLPEEVSPGATVTLDAGASHDPDPGDALTFTFEERSGRLPALTIGADPSRATFVAAEEGTLELRVVVSDGLFSATSEVRTLRVVARNHAPQAVVENVTARRGEVALLDASRSTDPDPGDGATLQFSWTAGQGAPVPSSGARGAIARVTAPADVGNYPYRLEVSDRHGATTTVDVLLTVVPDVPQPHPAPPSIVSVTPAANASNVPPSAVIAIDYAAPLDAVALADDAVSAQAGSTNLGGRAEYVKTGGANGRAARFTVYFTPDRPLPAQETVSVTVKALRDPYGGFTTPRTWTFQTRHPAWVEVSPPTPSGAYAFSAVPVAPVLASTRGLAAYLLYPTAPGFTSYNQPVLSEWSTSTRSWTKRADINSRIAAHYYSYPADGSSPAAPWTRAYLGADAAGLPQLAFDRARADIAYVPGDLSVLGQFGPYTSSPTYAAQLRLGAVVAMDGPTPLLAFVGCRQSPTTMHLFLQDMTRPAAPSSVDTATPTAAQGVDCNAFLGVQANDPWLSQPTAASERDALYLAYARRGAEGEDSQFRLRRRRAGETSLTTLTDALHPAGTLNALATGVETFAAMTPTGRGPIVVFLEGMGTQRRLRAAHWSLERERFEDPLTGEPGSSVVSPALPLGASFNLPQWPAIAAVGTTPYVAFTALSGHTRHVFVAYADRTTGAWAILPGSNADGSIDVRPGCQVSPPSIALVDGVPTVAWGESCPIVAQQLSQNHVVVKRLE